MELLKKCGSDLFFKSEWLKTEWNRKNRKTELEPPRWKTVKPKGQDWVGEEASKW